MSIAKRKIGVRMLNLVLAMRLLLQFFPLLPDTDTTNMNKAAFSVLKRIKNSAKKIQILEGSATYNKKYKGLPKNTPVPEIPQKYMDMKRWDFWEWWAGEGGLTKAVQKEGLRTGPPITHSTGWCLKIPAHRKRLLELLVQKKVKVLFGALPAHLGAEPVLQWILS